MLMAVAAAALAIASPGAQSKFTLKVHTGRGQIGYDVNSTMIIGEKDMLVIDPQFSLSEAHRLAAEILESKKNLAMIYITHPHPDHLFGLAVLKQAFPDAKIVALPATVNRGKDRLAGPPEVLVPDLRQQHPGPGSGDAGGSSPTPVLTLEGRAVSDHRRRAGRRWPGQQLRLHPVAQGSGHRRHRFRSRLLRRAEGQGRENWLKTIDQIAGVEAGDRRFRATRAGRDARHAAIEFMKKYIADWDANVAQSKDAGEMRANVLRQYPGLGMEFTPRTIASRRTSRLRRRSDLSQRDGVLVSRPAAVRRTAAPWSRIARECGCRDRPRRPRASAQCPRA